MFKFGKNKEVNEEELKSSFMLGVKEVFRLINSQNVIVGGHIKGTVYNGAKVCLSNPGADDNEIMVLTVGAIETAPQKRVTEATDCDVTLYLENAKECPIRKGSVIYTDDHSAEDVRTAYVNAMGDTYILKQRLELSDEELNQLSIVDCAELWRMFFWFRANALKETEDEEKQENDRRMERLAAALCHKIMNADEIYCLFNKATGEPHMLSRTIKQENGYSCMPPDILIFTKACLDLVKKGFSEEKYDLVRIENGSEKKGIYNFFGSTFYLNGARGVQVLSEYVVIGGDILVPRPDYSNVPPQNIPVTNPDLVRWMLLLGQLGDLESGDKELLYKLYYRFMALELPKAKFLIPIQCEGTPQQSQDGKVTPEKIESFKMPMMEGKNGRSAVRMFTDWRRLRMVYDATWGGMIQTIDDAIEQFDCAINATKFYRAGGYIDKEMYEVIKKMP